MIKVIYGKKGAGKTKVLIDTANELAKNGKGDVVFIDDSSQLMYDLKHEVRFINVADFPVGCPKSFLGFISGVVSEDYDIEAIFIDGLTYIVKQEPDSLKDFFEGLKKVSEKYNIHFYMTINGDPQTTPEFIKEYTA